jgi:hypothetical protein
MGKPSKRKYLQAFLERSLQIQTSSSNPESFTDLILWVRGRLEMQPTKQKLNQTNLNVDRDLATLSARQLRKEITQLRNAIREHRNEKGHGRCWLDDQRLYAVLPENQKANFSLPARDEFLANCAAYWQERQPLSANDKVD